MIFRILAKNGANITKASFHFSRLTFCQKKSFWRKWIQHLRIFREKISEFRRESVYKQFLREQILQKGVFESFFDRGRESFKLSQKFAAELSWRQPTYPKDEFLEKNLEVYSSLFFSDTAQNFLDFMRRAFCWIINCAFYSPKGSFWEKFVFEIFTDSKR